MNNWPARAALSFLLCAPALVWTVDLLAETPLLILVAATAPATLLAVLVLFAQRGRQRSRGALALALLWGAIGAAYLSSTGNEHARPWMTSLAGEGSRTATAVFVAPALEEITKALGFALLWLLAPGSVRGVRDGIVYGALIGVGFVWTENLLYLGVSMLQGGEDGLMRALYLRGILGGVTHTVFTACSGAAFGWWASQDRRGSAAVVAMLAAALAAPIAQHVLWNAFAAPLIAQALCGAAGGAAGGAAQSGAGQSAAACADVPTLTALFGSATLIAALFLTPGLAMVTAAWRSAGAGPGMRQP